MVKPKLHPRLIDDANSNVVTRKRNPNRRTPAERAAIATYVKRKRKEAGWGVSAFASAIGLTHGSYQAYEGGKTPIPSRRLAEIATVLNMDHDLLLIEIAAVCVQAGSEEHSV